MPTFEYGYWPLDRWTSPDEVKASMPQNLRALLLRPDRYGMFVDAQKPTDVRAIDAYLKIKGSAFTRPKFYRALHAEVSRQELHFFRFYRVLPRVWQPDKHLQVDLTATSTDAFLSSIRVQRPAPARPLLFDLDPMKLCGRILRATSGLAAALSCLTGLNVVPVASVAQRTSSGWHALIVTARGSATGDRLVPEPGFDRATKVIVAPHVAGWRLQDEQMADADFQMVVDLQVKTTTYHYARPHLILSARAVELLLAQGTRPLGRPARILNEPFVPVPTTSELHRLNLMP